MTFILSDSKERRHIPNRTLQRIKEPDFLPDGFVVVGYQFQHDVHVLSAATSDTALFLTPGAAKRLARSERLKFGIQYDRLILACTYVNARDSAFFATFSHWPIYHPGKNLMYDADFDWVIKNKLTPLPFAETALNYFLLGLSYVWEPQIGHNDHSL